MTEPQKAINKKIIGIALIALLLALYNMSLASPPTTFLKSEKLIYSNNSCCGIISYVNITGLSILNDSFYKIYMDFNNSVLNPAVNIDIAINDDFNSSNYSREYVYASGSTLVSALDSSTDISAASPGMSAQTKMLISKTYSGTVRIVLEGNFEDGITFFNMQMYYHNKVTDVTKITIYPTVTSAIGTNIYVFALR